MNSLENSFSGFKGMAFLQVLIWGEVVGPLCTHKKA